MFPPKFAECVSAELGPDETSRLMAALDGEPTVAVRLNPAKMRDGVIEELPAQGPIPWSRYGFYLTRRPVFTLDPMWHAGAYYVQEPSSQFVEHIVREAVGAEIEGARVLDLCAAPGGKTTIYSTLVTHGGLVVANEPVKNRAGILADNVRRWGLGNVAVTCNEPAALGAYRHFFDVMAVDAPCSGEGMFRKDRASREEWSPQGVEMCAARQRKIITDVWEALRPGGILIYSTCTFNRRENEDNVRWMVENFDVEPIEIEVPESWGVDRSEGGFRFYPHRLPGEGFFAAVLRKADGKSGEKVRREAGRARRQPLTELEKGEAKVLAGWLKEGAAFRFARADENVYAIRRAVYEDVAAMAGGLNVIYSGVCMGRTFGGKLRPDHALALFVGLNFDTVELTRDQALDYLRKRDFSDIARLHEGLNLLANKGLPIGWVKRIGGRANSLLPNGFRIVNL